jgi:hypothetical protein
MTNKPYHSWEDASLALFIASLSLALFVFWRYKKSLLNFQAWSLLMALINTILFIHFSPKSVHLRINELEYQLTPFVLRTLIFLQFLTSAVTIWRLWELSERYIPKNLVYQSKLLESKGRINGRHTQKSITVRSLALWHTIKNGGNNQRKDKEIQKSIRKIAKG